MNQKEFKRRRSHLMHQMGENSIAIIPTAPVANRNNDVDYAFRPDSDFYYLTGFPEPEAVAALIPGRKHGEYVLFCRERDPKKEQWNGLMAGQEGATTTYGANDSFPYEDLDEILLRMLEDKERVYYAMGCNLEFDHHMSEWVNRVRQKSRSGISGPIQFTALDYYVHDMRLFKSREEINQMRTAAEISASGHQHMMQQCQVGLFEYQLEAEFIYTCARQGGRSQAYPSIVGAGKNGCILHYIENQDTLNDGDLLLVDAGCEYQLYASDITRTYPVNGKFSEPQAQLYQLVLDAQLAAIDKVKPGNHWNEPHQAAIEIITQGLLDLGILEGDFESLLEDEAFKPFYMHRTGHWLGMDVHDVGDYKVDGNWRKLEAGMTLTVEPGIYIMEGQTTDERWWNIGIRIEDDVLVTMDGHEVLSKNAPKQIADIERIMSENTL